MPKRLPKVANPLETAVQPQTMARFFRRALRSRLPSGATITHVQVLNRDSSAFKRAVAYQVSLRLKTGQRVRYRIWGNIPSADTPGEIVTADHTLRTLHRHGFSQPPFQVPIPLGFYPRRRLFLYEDVRGTVLRDALVRNSPAAVASLKRAGRWLAKLHATNLQLGKRRTLERVRREAQFFYDDLKRAAPELLPRVAPLIEALVRLQGNWWPTIERVQRLVHGDFKPGNLVLRRTATVAIDFGNSRLDDPLTDVGNFRAQVSHLGWRLGWSEHRTLGYRSAFLQGYQQRQRLGQASRARLASQEAWWQMQLTAYAASTNRRRFQAICQPALASIEAILTRLKVDWRPWERPGQAFQGRFLQDERALASFFRAHLNHFFPGAVELISLRVSQPAAFSEDSRLTAIGLQLRMEDGSVHARQLRGNRVDRSAVDILRRLGSHSSLIVPRVLWYQPANRYLFYEAIPGQPFRQLPFQLPVLRRAVRAIGRTLAVLHRLPTTGVARWSWQRERRELTSLSRRIRHGRLSRGREFVRRLDAFQGWAARWWAKLPQVIAHNDFQGSNILIMPAWRIGLIDFTRSGVGPLPIDAAQFLTHLTVMLAPQINRAGRQSLRRTFLNAYRTGLPVSWRSTFDRTLNGFELRTALDIIATSADHLDRRTFERVLAPLFDDFPQLPSP